MGASATTLVCLAIAWAVVGCANRQLEPHSAGNVDLQSSTTSDVSLVTSGDTDGGGAIEHHAAGQNTAGVRPMENISNNRDEGGLPIHIMYVSVTRDFVALSSTAYMVTTWRVSWTARIPCEASPKGTTGIMGGYYLAGRPTPGPAIADSNSNLSSEPTYRIVAAH